MPIDYIPYLRKKVGHDEILSVGIACVLINDKNEVLLEKRRDNGLYCLPGGSIDLYETVKEGLIREVKEETGLTIDNMELFSIRSGEKEIFRYPNGDVTHYVDLAFISYIHGDIKLPNEHDSESTKIYFCPLDKLPKKEEFLRGSYETIMKYVADDFKVTVD